jgi:hypothetical protein
MVSSIPNREFQKIKLVGGLWTFKLILSILRDLLLIVFVLVAIGVLVFLASSVSQLPGSLGGIGLSSLVGSSNGGSFDNGGLEQTLQSELQQFKNDVNAGNWNAASFKLTAFEMLANKVSAPSEMKMVIAELRNAVHAHDKAKVNQLLSQFESQSMR